MGLVDSTAGELELLDRLRRGDAAAFDGLCRQFDTPLFSYVRNMVQDRCEAEDIAQEALLRLYVAAREGKVRTAPRAYAFSTAHNLAVDAQRRSRRYAGAVTPVPERAEPPVAASAGVERSLLRAEIDKALGMLPEKQRSAVLLREFGGLQYAEIAQTLGVSVEQVKVWIYRARKHLARVLDRSGQFVGGKAHGL